MYFYQGSPNCFIRGATCAITQKFDGRTSYIGNVIVSEYVTFHQSSECFVKIPNFNNEQSLFAGGQNGFAGRMK